MSNILGKENKIEILVRKELFSIGYRFRKNDNRYPGSPDIFLPKYRTAIFVHGCFWHGHKNCKKSNLPKTNFHFWKTKINSNIQRDKRIKRELTNMGIFVIIIWSCELQSTQKRFKRFEQLIEEINQSRIG